MSDPVLIALIGAGASVLAATVGLINTWHLSQTKNAVTTLEKNTNSIKDELVKVTGQAEFAKGLKLGQETKNV